MNVLRGVQLRAEHRNGNRLAHSVRTRSHKRCDRRQGRGFTFPPALEIARANPDEQGILAPISLQGDRWHRQVVQVDCINTHALPIRPPLSRRVTTPPGINFCTSPTISIKSYFMREPAMMRYPSDTGSDGETPIDVGTPRPLIGLSCTETPSARSKALAMGSMPRPR